MSLRFSSMHPLPNSTAALALAACVACTGCGDHTLSATSGAGSGGAAGTGGAGGSGGSSTTGGNGSGAAPVGGTSATSGASGTDSRGANGGTGEKSSSGGSTMTGTGGSSGSAGSAGGAGKGGSAGSGGSDVTGGTTAAAGMSGDAGAGDASGGMPAGLPSHVLVGWGASDYNDTWAQKTGTGYDVQWLYLSGQSGNDWYNGFTYSKADGSFLDGVLTTIDAHGFIPGLHLYNIGYGHDQGDAGLLTEIQNPAFTKSYFTEFKVFLQRIKAFGKPVVVVIEGDSFGMLEMLAKNDSTTMAAVAASGLPELAGLPDTIAGFGMAYLALRQAVGGVPNLAMGPDTPYYAADGDIMNWPPSDQDDLQAHVDYQWSFFSALGVGENQTGDRFDFSASCPRAADQDAYTDGRDKWSASDDASVNAPSINRYVEWLSSYHRTSGKPWLLHQVPIGNSQHLDQDYSASKPRSGYKDILVEYLFQYESPASASVRSMHVGKFADAGVIGLLFGFSDDGDQPTNDLWTDNQPFFDTHVAAFVKAGGYPL